MSRIIAGSRGGQRIAMPPGDRIRPTTDRVREALFSAIAAWAGTAASPAEQSLDGLAFCDLYAGSGAVGLEAASRGASRVLLVERDPRMVTAQQAQRRSPRFGCRYRRLAGRTGAAEVFGSAIRCHLRRPAVRAGHPYRQRPDRATRDQRWVDEGSLIVVERSRRSPKLVWPDVAAKRWTRAYGETILAFGSIDPEPGGDGEEEP